MAEPLESEVERLRAEIEAWRTKEVADLKAALAIVCDERDAARRDCDRLELTARRIAADYEKRLTDLRTKLSVFTNVDVSTTTRPGRTIPAGRGGS
jgi:hypothetical protein